MHSSDPQAVCHTTSDPRLEPKGADPRLTQVNTCPVCRHPILSRVTSKLYFKRRILSTSCSMAFDIQDLKRLLHCGVSSCRHNGHIEEQFAIPKKHSRREVTAAVACVRAPLVDLVLCIRHA